MATCTVRNIDCLVGMAEMEPRLVDVLVTSPPYNIGTRYSSYNDRRARQDYLDWMWRFTQQAYQVMRPGGSMFINIGAKPTDPTIPFEVLGVLMRLFKLQNTIHWVKSITIEKPGLGQVSAGHFKPLNSNRFLNDCHEYVFHLTVDGCTQIDRKAIGVPYADASNAKRWKTGSGVRCRGNTWFIPYDTIQDRNAERPHPATFPVALPKMCIQLHGITDGMTVLDPFMGLGTTAEACDDLDVNFVGFEIDRSYVSYFDQHRAWMRSYATGEQLVTLQTPDHVIDQLPVNKWGEVQLPLWELTKKESINDAVTNRTPSIS